MEDWVFVRLCNWFDVWLICNLPVFLFQLLCFGEGGKEVIACYYWYWRLSSQSLKRTLASVSEKQRIRFVHLWLIWHVLRLRFFCYDLWITVVFGFFDGGASLCWSVTSFEIDVLGLWGKCWWISCDIRSLDIPWIDVHFDNISFQDI